MYRKKRLSAVLVIFLSVCAAINFFSGHTGAAACSLAAGVFYLAVSSAAYAKKQKGKESKEPR